MSTDNIQEMNMWMQTGARWRYMKQTLAEKCCNIFNLVPVAPEFVNVTKIEDIRVPGKYIDAQGNRWEAK